MTELHAPLCIASADAGLRRRAERALTRQGYTTVEAASLTELAGRAQAGVQLALIDPRMPDLQPAPMSRVRAEPAMHKVPVLMLSPEDIHGLAGRHAGKELIDLVVRIHAQLAGHAQLDLLHSVSLTLTASSDMEHTLNAVFSALGQVLHFDTATLFLLDRVGKLFIRAAWGYELQAEQLRSFEVGEGVVGWVVANRAPTIVGDSDMDGRFISLDGRSSRSMLGVPLMVGERVVGAITLVRRAPAVQFTDDDLLLVATIGNSAAIALENARVHEQERALALRLEELNQLYGQEREVLDKLTESERVYGDVLSTVSHELKTPLMGIRGFAQMIRDGDVEGDEVRDSATEIYENAVRLSTYVERMLQEQAVHEGKETLDLRDVRIRPLVQQVIKQLFPGAPNHELVNDVSEDAPGVSGDPDKIMQILINLVSNAVKYSPRGGIVRVTCKQSDRWLEVMVSDQGVGIPPEARSRVFDRFFRISSFETKGIPGTGLGLSIVKGLVELHGGRIWVESEVGRGSSFHVTLPQTVYFPAPAEYSKMEQPAVTAEGAPR
ncbi:MAG TPA: ATP-binding protein [Candidatus Dormibacteraeota bacterium]|jgi:signal transduction histidine kinase|nr:ATP-binding protein [Candidatus Dormibacteraeota bacterium]